MSPRGRYRCADVDMRQSEWRGGSDRRPRLPGRAKIFVPAIVAVLVIAFVGAVRSSHAQAVAGECLAKPNVASPKGSHWYCRVDRIGNRRCWYLRPEGVQPRALKPQRT